MVPVNITIIGIHLKNEMQQRYTHNKNKHGVCLIYATMCTEHRLKKTKKPKSRRNKKGLRLSSSLSVASARPRPAAGVFVT